MLSVEKEAEILARLINDLMERNGLNAMQAASKFHELFENLEKSFSHAEVSSALNAGQHLHGTIGPMPGHEPTHMRPTAAFDTAVPLLTFVCLMLRWAARSLKVRR